jgi:hypothetical protein
MPEFLRLPAEDQRDILLTVSAEMGRSTQVLYKDIWVCWALRELFRLESGVRMAFKGGTSLSKVFQAINRFSEDVDVTLDYRDLSAAMDVDVFSPETSKSARKRFSKELSEKVRDHVQSVVYPTLTASFSEITAGLGATEVSDDGEKLWLRYPVLTDSEIDYMGDWILVEFGGRNVTEPNGPHEIEPLIAKLLPDLQFPVGNVMVLSPERTFWEKATMIHVESHRQRRSGPDRISRHWYDLAILFRGEIGRRALADRQLLEDVVRHKSVFFDASYAHYKDCLAGKFVLVPTEPNLGELKKDYQAMRAAGMFDVEVPDFEQLLGDLRVLEDAINA